MIQCYLQDIYLSFCCQKHDIDGLPSVPDSKMILLQYIQSIDTKKHSADRPPMIYSSLCPLESQKSHHKHELFCGAGFLACMYCDSILITVSQSQFLYLDFGTGIHPPCLLLLLISSPCHYLFVLGQNKCIQSYSKYGVVKRLSGILKGVKGQQTFYLFIHGSHVQGGKRILTD